MSERRPHHSFHVQTHLGELPLDISANLLEPWSLLFGPSGSGKSSILRALCGLLPDAMVTFHSGPSETQDLADLPIHLRRIAYAPQQSSLFPHLSVRENVVFAARVRSPQNRRGAAPAQKPAFLADQACELFRLSELWSRRPAELSGGEQQRVNLARAWAVPDAHLLLLDEPFNGFDRPLRDRILPDLRSALAARQLPVLSVTHDIEEAFLLGAEVLRLNVGQLIAQGPASSVLASERATLLAALTSPVSP